jgi:hypothetical protein
MEIAQDTNTTATLRRIAMDTKVGWISPAPEFSEDAMKPFSQAGKGPNGHRATVIEHKESAQLFNTLSQMRYRSMHPSGV